MRHRNPKIKIKALTPLNEFVAEMAYEPIDEYMGFHKNTQVVVYAFVTAFARIGMAKDLRKLMARGARLYYTGKKKIFLLLFV